MSHSRILYGKKRRVSNFLVMKHILKKWIRESYSNIKGEEAFKECRIGDERMEKEIQTFTDFDISSLESYDDGFGEDTNEYNKRILEHVQRVMETVMYFYMNMYLKHHYPEDPIITRLVPEDELQCFWRTGLFPKPYTEYLDRIDVDGKHRELIFYIFTTNLGQYKEYNKARATAHIIIPNSWSDYIEIYDEVCRNE